MEIKLSKSAVDSASEMVGAGAQPGPFQRTDAEKTYDAVVASCVRKPCHEQLPAPEGVKARLYTVTTISASARFGGTRTPAVFTSFNEAKEIVERNAGDIFETSYKLVVIEAVVPDVLYGGCLQEQYWYRWEGSYEEGGYAPVEVPAAYADTVGFGIG